MLTKTRADLGFDNPEQMAPAWLRDNPFLIKTSRVEMRRFGISLRLGLAALILSALLLGGFWLLGAFPGALHRPMPYLPGGSFPSFLFVVLSFAHVLLISNSRTAQEVSLGDEARRGTLSDLLLTPMRRAEMLLAMGIGPARGALLVALVGLPIYLILAQLGGVTWEEITALYVLLALLSYSPPSYILPALSGAAATPDNPLTVQTQQLFGRKQVPRTGVFSASWVWSFLFLLFFSQGFAFLGGSWLTHLLQALHVDLPSGPIGRIFGRFMLFFAWPYYITQIFGTTLDFFHLQLFPLLLFLPLAALHWTASALKSASALSAGSVEEMRHLPLYSRAQTVARWTARAATLLAVGVLWKAWVESGDTASLAASAGGGSAWDAAGLLLLLGGISLYSVLNCALLLPIRKKDGKTLRPYFATLRRGVKRSLRPLVTVGVLFLLACTLGGLSPFVRPVGAVAGRLLLVGLSGVIWAIGLRRLLPRPGSERLISRSLLYGLPIAVLSLPIPGLWNLAALSPVSAWLSLFPDGPTLLTRFPFWTLGTLPPFEVCVAGSAATGLLLAALPTLFLRRMPALLPVPAQIAPPVKERNSAWTAALMAWVTARTDNPFFTQELRARTRSGSWAEWRFYVPVIFVVSTSLALAYPTVVENILPFHLLQARSLWANLAMILLLLQSYTLMFRGQVLGETMIVRDQQRGIWGFILLTPQTARQIFWGKIFGQTSGVSAAWLVCALFSLIFYVLAAPAVGMGAALAAWLTGQVFVAALFSLGLSLGAAVSTFPIFMKGLRGVSFLLFVCAIGGGIFLLLRVLPEYSLQVRLVLGSVYAILLAVPAFLFAEWRVAALRKQDIAFGDGAD
jgi:hypothetical protein